MKATFVVQASEIGIRFGNSDAESTDREFVVVSASGVSISLMVDPTNDRLQASGVFELSDDAFRVLNSLTADSKLPKEGSLLGELRTIQDELKAAADRLISGLKHYFNQYELSDLKAPTFAWLKESGEGIVIQLRLRITAYVQQCRWLDDESAPRLQAFLDSGMTLPFSGLRHLHRARCESDPSFAWIDATIAAELAIKECLIQLEPKLATILLEVPSPPLPKLYGAVLESVVGKRSCKLKELRKGIEKRNELVHRPTSEAVDHQETLDYLDDVEIAIFELLSFMYPTDPIIEEIYKKRVTVFTETVD